MLDISKKEEFLSNNRDGWEVVSSEYISKRPWHTVRQEVLKLPHGGVIKEYYVYEYPDWVNILAVTKQGKFVFVKQYRRGIDKTLLELCAGTCDKEGEQPLDAAKRELLEETGYGGGDWSLLMTVSANPGTHNNITYCFLAEGVEFLQYPEPEQTEFLSVHLLTLEQVKEMLNSNQMKQSLHAAPLWKYLYMKK